MWVDYKPVDVAIDDDRQEFFHVFEIRIGMNEFGNFTLDLSVTLLLLDLCCCCLWCLRQNRFRVISPAPGKFFQSKFATTLLSNSENYF